MLAAEVYPAVGYGGAWTWLALGLLLAALLLPALAWLVTRPRKARAAQAVTGRDLEALRFAALGEIARVRRAHAEGTLNERAAHQELSRIVRGFVANAWGTDTDRLTLEDLQRRVGQQPALAPVAAFVAEVYPPNFARDTHREVAQSLAEAERLVSLWR